MTLQYFKDQIHEELQGAKDYIDKAIEVKPTNRRWSMLFTHMADMEADHAGNLMKMLEQAIQTKEFTNSPVAPATPGTIATTMDPEELYKNLMKEFGETMTYVTNMKRGL